MDDDRSAFGSVYWDATSIRSDLTMANEDFYTPLGSLMDLSISDGPNDDAISQSDSTTPQPSEIELPQRRKAQDTEVSELVENNVFNDSNGDLVSSKLIPEKSPSITQRSASAEIEVATKLPEKKNWRRSFAKRVSFTKTRILKSLSKQKSENKSRGARDVLLSVRNSFRRLRSVDKNHATILQESKSIKETLGSDCDYFNFDKCSSKRDSDTFNGAPQTGNEVIPIKPRRQFPQEKYLTGSEEMLQKAYNSLNRKSQLHEDKSLFDLCSSLKHLLESDNTASPSSRSSSTFVADCMDAFLQIGKKQIENSLLLTNRTIGQSFDLFSDGLHVIEENKKFKVEELLGADGVCIITDTDSRQRYVALKKTSPRNWISFTGFLQHIEKEVDTFEEQSWVCYPAESVTNMYLERDCFEPRLAGAPLILDCLLQLMVLVHCQLTSDSLRRVRPADVLLISSHCALICVFDSSERDECDSPVIDIKCDESMRQCYQSALMGLSTTVAQFLTRPECCLHLISASYPLDYLFFILLKLHRDINVLLDTL